MSRKEKPDPGPKKVPICESCIYRQFCWPERLLGYDYPRKKEDAKKQ